MSSKGATVATRKSDATAQRVVDAAAQVFREKGYGGAKLSDIARAARMQTGSLYYYFDSREALVERVLELGTTRIIDAVQAAIETCPLSATWRERIHAATLAHMAMALQHDDYTAATLRMFAQVPAETRARHRVHQEAQGRIWRELMAGAQAAGEISESLDLTIARLLFIGSMNWAIEWYKPERGEVAPIAAQLVNTFFDGAARR